MDIIEHFSANNSSANMKFEGKFEKKQRNLSESMDRMNE